MARQVFFDPFGSYVNGFDAGASRQTQTEGAMRQARAQDFDFNNLAPFRLAAAQREDQLGKTTLPYQEALAPLGLLNAQGNYFDAQNKRAQEFGQAFSTPAPFQKLNYDYFGIQPTTTSVGGGNPVTTLYMNDANGNPVPVSQHDNFSQNVLDYLNWQRNLQSRQLGDLEQYRAASIQNTADRNDAYQTQAQARMLGAFGRYYQGAGGVNGNTLFSSGANGGMPMGLAQPGYYQFAEPQAQPDPGLTDFNIGGQ